MRWLGVRRWDACRLNPDLRRRIDGLPVAAVQAADIVPATQPVEDQKTTLPGQGGLTSLFGRVRCAQNDPVLGETLEGRPRRSLVLRSNNVGLSLLDDDGHLLVPYYVEREAIGTESVQALGPDGVQTNAKFIGSDRQTNLTCFCKSPNSAGKPIRLGSGRPKVGSLVMLLSPTDASGASLAMWSDGDQDNGIVLTIDGQIDGIARHGQFLDASACLLIARQIIQFGSVKRAVLGVLISEVRNDAVNVKPVMRIDEVIAHSAVDRAGLKAGDLVLAVGGEPVSDLPTFAAAIAARTGPTRLQISRDGAVRNLMVDLEQQQ